MYDVWCVAESQTVPVVSATAIEEVAVPLIGSYRYEIGWRHGDESAAARDASYELLSRAH